MKTSEIDDCRRLYKRALGAYDRLKTKLHSWIKVAEGIPLLSRMKIEEAIGDLERIGEGLSVIPELTAQLLEERRINAILREQAAKAGVVLRYDQAEEEDGEEEEQEK